MFQGFYNLTSGMLTQTRKMNVISNNMANVSTPGFRGDKFTTTTFQQEMLYRTGNKDKSHPVQIGSVNRIVTSGGNVTSYEEGGIHPTDSRLDFALTGSGFFAVQSGNGTVYTRNGSFALDDQGYLYLDGVGRVLGTNGPIQLNTDAITVDEGGNIYSTQNGRRFGTLQVVDFANYDTDLVKTTGDVFTATGAPIASDAKVSGKALEYANVDLVSEMTTMMSSQRALQSAAQVLKMYDQLDSKTVQLGPA